MATYLPLILGALCFFSQVTARFTMVGVSRQVASSWLRVVTAVPLPLSQYITLLPLRTIFRAILSWVLPPAAPISSTASWATGSTAWRMRRRLRGVYAPYSYTVALTAL